MTYDLKLGSATAVGTSQVADAVIAGLNSQGVWWEEPSWQRMNRIRQVRSSLMPLLCETPDSTSERDEFIEYLTNEASMVKEWMNM